jgi:uncharacterized protein YcbX
MTIVRALRFTPVKGTRLHDIERVELGTDGVAGDRRFYVVDERGRMLNSKVIGALQTIVAEAPDGRLRLTFPDGRVLEDGVRDGELVATRFYSQPREHPVVAGPWSEALSDYLGRPVRLVRATSDGRALDRGPEGAVSLISSASLAALASQAEVESVDPRRFRMTVEVDGPAAHEEDMWVGRSVRIGTALVRFRGHVGRCLITSRDPDTGTVNLPTLDVLRAYRGDVEATEPLPFGIYGEVLEPGAVAVGDAVELLA